MDCSKLYYDEVESNVIELRKALGNVTTMLCDVVEYIRDNGQIFEYELFDEVDGLTEFWNEYERIDKERKEALKASAVSKLTNEELEVLDIKIIK